MAQAKYEVLKEEIEDIEAIPTRHSIVQRRSYLTWVFGLMMVVSLFLNMLQYTNRKRYDETYTNNPKDIPVVVVRENRTVDDDMWTSDRLNMNYGVVALKDEHARGRIPGDRYPWDPSRSIYFLQGYHVMHCVMVFRDLILSTRDKRPPLWPHGHMVHCLHTLREETECHANDFPLHISVPSREEEEGITPGLGETRMCRSWDALRDFALANTACWGNEWLDNDTTNDHYKHCPDGSKPWENL